VVMWVAPGQGVAALCYQDEGYRREPVDAYARESDDARQRLGRHQPMLVSVDQFCHAGDLWSSHGGESEK
jgi:hypothetical protein